MKLQEVIFWKSQTAHWASSTESAYSEHSMASPTISMAGYVAMVPACLQGTPRPGGEHFLWFNQKMIFCDFTAFSPFWLKQIKKKNRCAQ